MLKHKKFVNEKVCESCSCNFFPEKGYEKVQVSCRGCAELPEILKEPEIPIQEIESKQKNPENKENVGVCKKCFKAFTPISPANKICSVCKAK